MGTPLKFFYNQRTDNHPLQELQVSEIISIDLLHPLFVGPEVSNAQLGMLLCFRVAMFTEWTTQYPSVCNTPADTNSEPVTINSGILQMSTQGTKTAP